MLFGWRLTQIARSGDIQSTMTSVGGITVARNWGFEDCRCSDQWAIKGVKAYNSDIIPGYRGLLMGLPSPLLTRSFYLTVCEPTNALCYIH